MYRIRFLLFVALCASNSELFDKARKCFDKRDYEKSRQMFEDVINESSMASEEPDWIQDNGQDELQSSVVLHGNTSLDNAYEKDDNEIVYSYFYLALIAYRTSNIDTAESIFCKMLEVFPGWGQKYEVLIWLANISFEKDDYIKALEYIDIVNNLPDIDNDVREYVQQMKDRYVNYRASSLAMNSYVLKRPYDKQMLELWVEKQKYCGIVARRPWLASWLEKCRYIRRKKKTIRSIKKNAYDVALLLPIGSDKPDQADLKMCDLYNGAMWAYEEQKHENISIKLYDTKLDEWPLDRTLRLKELAKKDLIVGVFGDELQQMSRFSQKYKINTFDVMSSDLCSIGSNRYCYLIHSSGVTQAHYAAKFLINTLHIDNSANIVVMGSDSDNDIEQIDSFKTTLAVYNYNVSQVIKLSDGVMNRLLYNIRMQKKDEQKLMNNPGNVKQYIVARDVLDLKHITHVYVASSDLLVMTSLLSALKAYNVDPIVICSHRFLDGDLAATLLKEKNIYYIASSYVDYEAGSVMNFIDGFYRKFNRYPDEYAFYGYESMKFLLQQMSDYGTHPQCDPNGYKTSGDILSGVDYNGCHDNQHLLFLKYNNYVPEVLTTNKEYLDEE